MKEIKLTLGMVTKVDDEDFNYLNQWKWHAHTTDKNTWYAFRTEENRRSQGLRQRFMHTMVMRTESRVDHKNGDGLDNQKDNLRLATSLENSRNRRTHRTDKTSPYKGVCWHYTSNRWRAYINLEKQLSLGYFKDPIDAAYAYDRAATKHFGEFARLNFTGGMA